MLAGGPLEHAAGDAGLYRRRQILGLNCNDAIQARKVEADAAGDRDHVPFEAGAGTEGRHGHAILVGEPKHRRHVVGGLRVDDDIGPASGMHGHVLPVQIPIRLPGRDPRRGR